jgi:electron transfer flavoprotein beta subunit
MKIIVCVKQVPASDEVQFDHVQKKVVREGVELVINPLDLHGIEAALKIKDATGAEVVAVSLGPPPAEKALRRAIAMGCDRGVLVCDREFAGSDTLSTSKALAAVVSKLGGADLILCGDHTTDGDTGQVPAELAEMLGIPQATYGAEVEAADGRVTVKRVLTGLLETIETPMPALVTVTKAIGKPRRPSLVGLKRARTAEVTTMTAADLGLTKADVGWDGSPTKTLSAYPPPSRPQSEKVELPPERSAARIVEILSQAGVA